MATIPTIPSLPAGYVATATDMNNLSTAATFLLNKPAAYIYQTVTQTIGTTLTVITFGAARFDTDGMWTNTSADRLTVQTNGYYKVRYRVSNNGQNMDGAVYVTGGPGNPFVGNESASWAGSAGKAGTGTMTMTGGGLLPAYLYAGDYVRVKAALNGAASSVLGDYYCFLSLEFVSA